MMWREVDVERRHQIRISLSTRVLIEHEGGSITSETANVSEGGMFVPTEEPLPVGHSVDFRLYLEGGREAEGRARVMRSQLVGSEGRPQGNGFEFLEMDAESRRLLAASIRHHLETQPLLR